MYVNSLFRLRAAVTPTGLGDASTSVQVDTVDVLNLGNELRAAQSRLTNLLAQMRSDPELAAAIGRDVTAQQAALGDLIAKYVGVYTAVFGQAPVGLGTPIFLGAGIVLLIAAIAGWLYAWKLKQDVLEKQAQAQILAEQNRAALIDQAQQQQETAAQQAAAGNTAGAAESQATANAILAQAGIPGTAATGASAAPQTFTDWIKANWITVAAVGGAIFIVPRLMDR